jgi:hypothetical protein
LKKALYGLKQAPHEWLKTLHRQLTSIGFERCDSDHGLYILKQRGEIIMLLTVYVDDLLLMGTPETCKRIAKQLETAFELVFLGPVKYLLGVDITIDYTQRVVFFCQENYIKEILKRFHMANCNGVATPESETVLVESENDSKTSCDITLPYREIVGALQYLVSGSRPDLAHVVRSLGQFMSCYDEQHYARARRVLRYLKSTMDHGLLLKVKQDESIKLLQVYSDADYANNKDDRKSVSGYVTMIDGSVISYGSRKQGINAQSTMEAEYVAMNEGVRDLMWLKGLCEELQWHYEGAVLRGDNQAALYLSEKPGKHSKTKHIENKYHYVRDLVERDEVKTSHCGTEEMIADIMTKGLGRVKFQKFRSMMQVIPREEILLSGETVGVAGQTLANKESQKKTNNELVIYVCN